MTKFRPTSIKAMMDTYSKFDLNSEQLKQIKAILQSGKADVATTNALISDDAHSELIMGKRGNAWSQGKKNLLDFINNNTQAPTPTQPTPTQPTPTQPTPTQPAPSRPTPSQSPAPKPKVDPQKFLDSKKASVQPKVTPPKPAVSPTPAPKVTPTPTPPPTPPRTTQIPNTSPHNVKIKVPPTSTAPARGLVGGLLQRGAGLLTRGFGAAQALDGNAPASTRLIGAATVANPMLGFALSLGSGLGEWAEDNLPESDFVSGRGSGSAALSGKKQRRKDQQAISETIPQSLKVPPSEPTSSMTTNEAGALVSSDGGTVYSEDGKTYTTGGVTYSRDGSGQAINPDTGKVSSGGYSINPSTGARSDYKPGEDRGSGAGGSEVRQNEKGIVQKGMTLGGINTFLTGLGGRELADIKAMYATDTGSAPSVPSNMRGTEPEQPFFEGLPGLSAPTAPTGTTATTTETTSNPTNEQDGASDKPTLADNVRAVRMSRPRGARQQEFADRPGNSTFGGEEPDDSSLVSPMYRNSKRNEIRSAFLNMDRSSAQAAMDSAAVAGRYRDVIGSTDYYNYGGKAVQAKEGMERQAKNAAMMGEDPTEFLNIQPEQTPSAADTPTSLELNPDQGKKAAQEFKDFRAEEIKKGLK